MLNFLKRKSKTEARSTIGRLMEAPAFAGKIKSRKDRYLDRVKTLHLVLPAVRRKEDSVLELWDATRFEAIANLWTVPDMDIALIADAKCHGKRNAAIFRIDFRSVLSGDTSDVGQTCLAIRHVYDYLAAIGEEVFDPQSSPSKLKLHGKRVSDTFSTLLAANEAEWDKFHFDQAGGHEIQAVPLSIFEILWRDVTRLSKNIAICTKFGPDFQSGVEYRRVVAKNRPDELKRIADVERNILPLDDPDDILN
jgi:hypothetical protein